MSGERLKWLPQEDDRLREAVEAHGARNWKAIAKHLDGRTDVQCLHRWQKVLRPGLVKGPWTPEEDKLVIALVARLGTKKWSLIAQCLNGRLGKQCRERWYNHLDPSINKGPFSVEEDVQLLTTKIRDGTKWAAIALQMPGRTDNMLKNRYNSTLKRIMKGVIEGMVHRGELAATAADNERELGALEHMIEKNMLGEGTSRKAKKSKDDHADSAASSSKAASSHSVQPKRASSRAAAKAAAAAVAAAAAGDGFDSIRPPSLRDMHHGDGEDDASADYQGTSRRRHSRRRRYDDGEDDDHTDDEQDDNGNGHAANGALVTAAAQAQAEATAQADARARGHTHSTAGARVPGRSRGVSTAPDQAAVDAAASLTTLLASSAVTQASPGRSLAIQPGFSPAQATITAGLPSSRLRYQSHHLQTTAAMQQSPAGSIGGGLGVTGLLVPSTSALTGTAAALAATVAASGVHAGVPITMPSSAPRTRGPISMSDTSVPPTPYRVLDNGSGLEEHRMAAILASPATGLVTAHLPTANHNVVTSSGLAAYAPSPLLFAPMPAGQSTPAGTTHHTSAGIATSSSSSLSQAASSATRLTQPQASPPTGSVVPDSARRSVAAPGSAMTAAGPPDSVLGLLSPADDLAHSLFRADAERGGAGRQASSSSSSYAATAAAAAPQQAGIARGTGGIGFARLGQRRNRPPRPPSAPDRSSSAQLPVTDASSRMETAPPPSLRTGSSSSSSSSAAAVRSDSDAPLRPHAMRRAPASTQSLSQLADLAATSDFGSRAATSASRHYHNSHQPSPGITSDTASDPGRPHSAAAGLSTPGNRAGALSSSSASFLHSSGRGMSLTPLGLLTPGQAASLVSATPAGVSFGLQRGVAGRDRAPQASASNGEAGAATSSHHQDAQQASQQQAALQGSQQQTGPRPGSGYDTQRPQQQSDSGNAERAQARAAQVSRLLSGASPGVLVGIGAVPQSSASDTPTSSGGVSQKRKSRARRDHLADTDDEDDGVTSAGENRQRVAQTASSSTDDADSVMGDGIALKGPGVESARAVVSKRTRPAAEPVDPATSKAKRAATAAAAAAAAAAAVAVTAGTTAALLPPASMPIASPSHSPVRPNLPMQHRGFVPGADTPAADSAVSRAGMSGIPALLVAAASQAAATRNIAASQPRPLTATVSLATVKHTTAPATSTRTDTNAELSPRAQPSRGTVHRPPTLPNATSIAASSPRHSSSAAVESTAGTTRTSRRGRGDGRSASSGTGTGSARSSSSASASGASFMSASDSSSEQAILGEAPEDAPPAETLIKAAHMHTLPPMQSPILGSACLTSVLQLAFSREADIGAVSMAEPFVRSILNAINAHSTASAFSGAQARRPLITASSILASAGAPHAAKAAAAIEAELSSSSSSSSSSTQQQSTWGVTVLRQTGLDLPSFGAGHQNTALSAVVAGLAVVGALCLPIAGDTASDETLPAAIDDVLPGMLNGARSRAPAAPNSPDTMRRSRKPPHKPPDRPPASARRPFAVVLARRVADRLCSIETADQEGALLTLLYTAGVGQTDAVFAARAMLLARCLFDWAMPRDASVRGLVAEARRTKQLPSARRAAGGAATSASNTSRRSNAGTSGAAGGRKAQRASGGRRRSTMSSSSSSSSASGSGSGSGSRHGEGADLDISHDLDDDDEPLDEEVDAEDAFLARRASAANSRGARARRSRGGSTRARARQDDQDDAYSEDTVGQNRRRSSSRRRQTNPATATQANTNAQSPPAKAHGRRGRPAGRLATNAHSAMSDAALALAGLAGRTSTGAADRTGHSSSSNAQGAASVAASSPGYGSNGILSPVGFAVASSPGIFSVPPRSASKAYSQSSRYSDKAPLHAGPSSSIAGAVSSMRGGVLQMGSPDITLPPGLASTGGPVSAQLSLAEPGSVGGLASGPSNRRRSFSRAVARRHSSGHGDDDDDEDEDGGMEALERRGGSMNLLLQSPPPALLSRSALDAKMPRRSPRTSSMEDYANDPAAVNSGGTAPTIGPSSGDRRRSGRSRRRS